MAHVEHSVRKDSNAGPEVPLFNGKTGVSDGRSPTESGVVSGQARVDLLVTQKCETGTQFSISICSVLEGNLAPLCVTF